MLPYSIFALAFFTRYRKKHRRIIFVAYEIFLALCVLNLLMDLLYCCRFNSPGRTHNFTAPIQFSFFLALPHTPLHDMYTCMCINISLWICAHYKIKYDSKPK